MARSRIAIHVGLHHLAQRDVGGGEQLAVVLLDDAADAGAAIGAEGQQCRLVDAAVGGEPQGASPQDGNVTRVEGCLLYTSDAADE